MFRTFAEAVNFRQSFGIADGQIQWMFVDRQESSGKGFEQLKVLFSKAFRQGNLLSFRHYRSYLTMFVTSLLKI